MHYIHKAETFDFCHFSLQNKLRILRQLYQLTNLHSHIDVLQMYCENFKMS